MRPVARADERFSFNIVHTIGGNTSLAFRPCAGSLEIVRKRKLANSLEPAAPSLLTDDVGISDNLSVLLAAELL